MAEHGTSEFCFSRVRDLHARRLGGCFRTIVRTPIHCRHYDLIKLLVYLICTAATLAQLTSYCQAENT